MREKVRLKTRHTFCIIGEMRTDNAEENIIESKIYLIRGEKLMLDHDLAELYEISTGRLK